MVVVSLDYSNACRLAGAGGVQGEERLHQGQQGVLGVPLLV